MLKQSFQTAGKFLSLVKFSHTIFAMPFALIGFFLAVQMSEADIRWILLLLVILCMVFARNAAMAFNRYADKEIDILNPRRAVREIPSGVIRAKSALLFTIINAILFVGTTWFINPLAFKLSPIALLVILGYSLTKKFTYLCHFILGLGLSLAPIGAYISVTGRFEILPILFSCIVFFWVSGFDIIYALQDEEFDKSKNLKSIPARIGKKNALLFSTLTHLIAAAFVILPGIIAHFGLFYWIGAIVFIGLLIYQHLLIKPNDLSKVNLAFFTTNGIASVIFAFFTIFSMYF